MKTLKRAGAFLICLTLNGCLSLLMGSQGGIVLAQTPQAAVTQADVDKEIDKLESNDFDTREKAQAQLITWANIDIPTFRLVKQRLIAKRAKLGLEGQNRTDKILAQIFPPGAHYKCYQIMGDTPNATIEVRTQFNSNKDPLLSNERGLTPGQPQFLCLPALKNPTGTEEEQQAQLENLQKKFPHLRLFPITGETPGTSKHLRDQFFDSKNHPDASDGKLGIGRAIWFAAGTLKTIVPSNEDENMPPPVPQPGSPEDVTLKNRHYKCYQLPRPPFDDPNARPTGIKLIRTQFSTEDDRTVMMAPDFLCAPALKNPTGTKDEQNKKLQELQNTIPHIMCHKLDELAHQPAGLKVNMRTQFALEEKKLVERAKLFCAPTDKSILLLAGQIHSIGPIPNRIGVGNSASITATVEDNFIGVGLAEVVFEKVRGNFEFTSGVVSDDGSRASVITDDTGAATINIAVEGTGAALIRITVTDTPLMAFSIFYGI